MLEWVKNLEAVRMDWMNFRRWEGYELWKARGRILWMVYVYCLKTHMWSPTPQGDGTWRWSLWKWLGFGEVLRAGPSGWDHRKLFGVSFCNPLHTQRSHVSTQLDVATCNPGEEASEWNLLSLGVGLRCPAARAMRVKKKSVVKATPSSVFCYSWLLHAVTMKDMCEPESCFLLQNRSEDQANFAWLLCG